MKRDGTNFEQRDPERRRSMPRKPSGYVQRASATGRSGYGTESIRPYLRDQIRLKELLHEPFPPEEGGDPPPDKG